MALQIEWTPDAREHLNDILKYWVVRNASTSYSKKLYKAVKRAVYILSKFPDSGKKTENENVRSKIVEQYFIFYCYDDKYLSILGICDMRRDPIFIKKLHS